MLDPKLILPREFFALSKQREDHDPVHTWLFIEKDSTEDHYQCERPYDVKHRNITNYDVIISIIIL